jgi:sigma-B regulation protein RsbU (phosphoserine phosphatase)
MMLYIEKREQKLEKKHRENSEKERMKHELAMGKSIQSSMLPHIFPPFPERNEFDLYASMDPAREVGGDFYDYFFIDDDHLCLLMADVSGKGIPGALFMMITKAILQNTAKLEKSPAKILTKANEAICANNQTQMFVTVWIGVLEISSGKMRAGNAGHEYPIIKTPEGRFEILKDRHDFVLGGMEDIRYHEYDIEFSPGSKIFLYTDGIPEATDANNRMFGMDRLLKTLNEAPDENPEQLLKNVRAAVDRFVNGAEQFDDLTMLCMEYKGKK